ncbi:MAG: septal ring lytic transglycosylase RlpA family protein [Salinivenus sp.]
MRLGGLLVLVAIACISCAATGRSAEDSVYQRGEASYYADKFEGRPTASGEPYDPEALTAAHRRLPFGTRVRVTRTDVPDAPSIVVEINDRGPFARGRIIDLSEEGARSLNMIEDGVAAVRVEIVERPDSADAEAFQRGAEGW